MNLQDFMIISTVLLAALDITVFRFYLEYKRNHPRKKEPQVFQLKEK